MKKITFLLFIILLAARCQADEGQKNRNALSDSKIMNYIYQKKYTHKIDGYQIKCDRTKVLVWGKPKKFNASHPQDSEATLVDLEKNKIVRTFGLSSGIFGAGFLKDGQRLNIESGNGVMIDLRTATEINYDYYFDTEGKYEECPDFKSRSFLRY